MTHALVVLHHGHARVLGDEANQRLAPARDGEVDVLALLDERANGVAIGERKDLHDLAREPRRFEPASDDVGQRRVRPRRLRTAAQDHGIAGLQRERARLDGHAGAGLVDHRHDADRYTDARDLEAVGADAPRDHVADRIGQRGDRANALGERRDAPLVEHEAIEHGAGRTLGASRLEVGLVGRNDVALPCLEVAGDGLERGVLHLARLGTNLPRVLAPMRTSASSRPSEYSRPSLPVPTPASPLESVRLTCRRPTPMPTTG